MGDEQEYRAVITTHEGRVMPTEATTEKDSAEAFVEDMRKMMHHYRRYSGHVVAVELEQRTVSLTDEGVTVSEWTEK